MLSKKIEAVLNKQINYELSAWYNYLAMQAWFENANLGGFARWMKMQAAEELQHANRIFEFVHDRGGCVELDKVEKPTATYKTPREVFARATELERQNTKAIHGCYALAAEEKDYATQSHLKWFIDEQVEEEKTTREIEALLEMAGDDQSALFMINRQLGERAAPND